MLSYIQQFEASFVKKEMEKAGAERKQSIEKAKADLVTLRRRDEDLDTLFKRIYEDMVSGRLSAERFDKLSCEYEMCIRDRGNTAQQHGGGRAGTGGAYRRREGGLCH